MTHRQDAGAWRLTCSGVGQRQLDSPTVLVAFEVAVPALDHHPPEVLVVRNKSCFFVVGVQLVTEEHAADAGQSACLELWTVAGAADLEQRRGKGTDPHASEIRL